MKMSEEFCKLNREGHLGKKHTTETKEKMSKIQKEVQNRPEIKRKKSEALKGRPLSEVHKQSIKEALNKPETKNKISEISKKWFGVVENKERHKKIMEERSGINHPNWNPNRAEVYAPYGENFYNNNIRNRKWNFQNGRDMLTGTKLDPDKRSAYHHINYDKSNDDPDNHCFISCNNHMRITGYQKNPIKSERYKKILQANTLALKNGEIPKNWSPLNKELFRQEKLKQLDLSSYII